ncbi:hypothetical protein GCM10008023_22700 [Sphingomonas glacialis]|uniref:Uncharacterized protein n=1 Tax=Sphingomonas glacialis TaxID=658225 RepID=A0ABQ3LJ13_9SPHN|nr:hypothetical protein GCM10008023_22700 [Sphingomonas glacialis]
MEGGSGEPVPDQSDINHHTLLAEPPRPCPDRKRSDKLATVEPRRAPETKTDDAEPGTVREGRKRALGQSFMRAPKMIVRPKWLFS